jgi:hypothetical protein
MFATPNAKRGPADQPNPVPSSFDATSNNGKRSGALSLPPALERRLSAIEVELAGIRQCVMACRGEDCPSACWVAGDGAR